MPPYEIVLILRAAGKLELKEIIKRALTKVQEFDGSIGQLENMGERTLPYRMRKHGERFEKGFYMSVEADMPASRTRDLLMTLTRDRDIIRPTLVRKEIENTRPCEIGNCFWGDLTETEHKMALKWGRFSKLPA